VSSIPADRYFPDLRAFAGSGPDNKARTIPLGPQIRHDETGVDSAGLFCIVEDSDFFGS
jgi:hypothetical protein